MASGSFERLPARIGGKYKPVRLVGSGGMSAVYEVEHEHTGERLALKVLKDGVAELDPAALERFRREARVAALVKSEHIVRVVDADVAPELDGAPFLVMDLLEGADLARATGDEPQAPEVVVGWLRQIAKALDKAHALGIIHRDLKPENLFLEERTDAPPIVKVLDFGVAKVRTHEDVKKTATGAVLGTPLYMSPEQAAGESSKIGAPTDVWALGLIAYRLLTGKDYWVANTVPALLAKIVYGKVEPPSAFGCDLGPAFDAWFTRSCAAEPADRWPSATQQVVALADALEVARPESSDATSKPTSPRVVTPSPSVRVFDATLPAPMNVPAPASDGRVSESPAVAKPVPVQRGRARFVVAAGVLAAAVGTATLVRSWTGNSGAPPGAAAALVVSAGATTPPAPSSAAPAPSTIATATVSAPGPAPSPPPSALVTAAQAPLARGPAGQVRPSTPMAAAPRREGLPATSAAGSATAAPPASPATSIATIAAPPPPVAHPAASSPAPRADDPLGEPH
jgi:serine/threonine-protein kinase